MLIEKQFGDIITFSRASAATRINPLGLIETVAANVPCIDYDPINLVTGTNSQTVALAKDRAYAVTAVGGTVAVAGSGVNVSQMGAASGVIKTPAGTGTVDVTFTPGGGVTALHVREVLGLSVWEQRTNYWINSAWPGISWFSNPLSITQNYGPSPMAGVNSTRLTRSADASSSEFNFTNCSAAALSGVAQTPSVFIKVNSNHPTFGVYAGNGNSTAGRGFNFTIANGVITPINGAIVSRLSNGWHRISFPFIPSADIGSYQTNTVFNFPAGALDIEVFGCQWEVGGSSSPYIPAGGAQVTRSADVPVLNTLSPWFNQPEGSLLAEFSMDTFGGAYFSPWSFDQGFTDRLGVIGTPDEFFAMKIVYPSASDAYSVAQQAHTGVNKVACGWGPSGLSQATNGNATQTGNHYGVPQANRLKIGAYDLPLNGHIRKIRYFPKRLSDAQLQSITA